MKPDLSKQILMAMLLTLAGLLHACGGGGGGGASTGSPPPAPGPTPVQMSTEATVSVLPSEMIKIPVNVEGTVTGATQVSGIPVSNLNYTMGVLSFLAPADTGKNEVLKFKLNKSDGTTVVYSITMATLLPPVISVLEHSGDQTASVAMSDISISVSSLVNVCVLPANFTDFSIVFSSPTGWKLATTPFFITLRNGTNTYRITDHFNVNPATGVVSLKPSFRTSFVSKLSDKLIELSIVGRDTKGLPFGFGIVFYYGSNTLNGRAVNSSGSPMTALAGKSVLLRGFTSGVSQKAVISANGNFSLSNVVTDNFELSLIDPASQYFGTSLFLIPSGNAAVNVDLKVIAPMQLKTAERALRIEKAPVIEENQNGLAFEKNEEIEIRSIDGSLEAKTEILKTVSGNTVSVRGGAQNVTVEDQTKIRVAQGTLRVKIKAEVSTAEYPSFTTKPGNKYNDTWQYWWGCGMAGDLVGGSSLTLIGDVQSGLVNTTHSTAGTRVYEKEFDASPFTKNSPIDCAIGGSTANIGDGVFPTTVAVTLSTVSGLTINQVSYQGGLFPDDSGGGNQLYNMGVPLSDPGPLYGGAPFKIQVQYEPKDAEIEKMKIELSYDGKTFLVRDFQSFTPVAKGLLVAEVTFSQGLYLQPKEGLLASLLVTLTGKVKGVSDTSKPKAMQFLDKKDSFTPLFEVRNAISAPSSKRYSDDRYDSKGGDGWARADMLNWVNTGAGKILVYNDISGEHAWRDAEGKSLGAHQTHKGGYELDARYYDENGQYLTGMVGQSYNKVGGYYIRQVVQVAQEEVENDLPAKPNLTKLVNWINRNRTLLEQLAADPKVKLIYIGFEEWFWQPLIWGKFADGVGIPGVYSWLNWPEEKVEMMPGHESHIHVGLHPK